MDGWISADDVRLTEAGFRSLAADRLDREPSEAIFDPRTGQAWGRGDWDLNPELLADFAAMPPARPAAVLFGIVARDELTVLLTQRTRSMRTHAGQIAFPGGRLEPSDDGPVGAALRESVEEISLDPKFVEPLGFLDGYRTGTGFTVAPVVALIRPGFELKPDPREVDDVFEVPLAFLMNEANHQQHSRDWKGRQRYYYAMPYGDRYIWGRDGGNDPQYAAEAVREMIRVIIENVLLFLLPTVVYVIYVAVTRDDTHKGIFDEVPLAWLMLAGCALMIAVLVTFGAENGGRPGQTYVPPSMKDGQIEPGRIQ